MRSLIMDCDPGVDDALALVLATCTGRVRILGITTVFGNVSVSQTTTNVCRLLDYFNQQIPVAKGSSKPMKVSRVSAKEFHGNDGLGDSHVLPKKSERKLDPRSASDFMIDLVRSGATTLLATGPLTNVAQAFQKDRKVMNRLQEIVIMGGAFLMPGNASPLAEFNFFADPDAADFVLSETRVRKVVVPLNVTHKVIATLEYIENLKDTRSGKLVKSIDAKYLQAYMRHGFSGNPMHDPLAMGYCIDETFLQLRPASVHVESRGTYTRGVCVLEETNGDRSTENVRVASSVDAAKFLDYFKDAVNQS